jgi:PBSX family phage terminase large subunit
VVQVSNTKQIEVIPIYYDYILTTNYPVNLLVGGRNSGKSFFMEQQSVIKMHNKKKYKLLVIEDVETNIGAGVKSGIENRIGEFGYDPVFRAIKQPPEVIHRYTGSNTIFKGYHSKEQQKQVKSLNEVTAAWYEEAENITYEQFKALRMQLRGGDEEDRQLFLSLNPINEDGFISEYFFKNDPDKVFERFPDGRPKVFEKQITVEMEHSGKTETVTIPCIVVVSTHWDNPYLTAEQHADIEELKYRDKDLYAMLAEGKFVKGSGVYFPEFESHIHVIENCRRDEGHRIYRVLDYGLDKLACYWVDVDSQGKAKFYKEIWQSDLIISEAAKKINEMTVEPIFQTLAPPDLWNRRQETGRSAAEIFQDNGIYLTQASNDVEQGCLDLKEWLYPYKTRDEQTGDEIITADMQVTVDCAELINSLKNIKKDEKNPNIYATTPHELTHSVDAARYFVAGRPRPPRIEKKPKNKEFEHIFGKKEVERGIW